MADSLRLEEVTFGYRQIQPTAADEVTQSALYLVLCGCCRVTTAGDPPLRLSMGDLGVIPGGSAHRVAADTSAGGPIGITPTKLIWFRFRLAGEPAMLASLVPRHLSSAQSRAAAWLWRLAPLLVSSPADLPSPAACSHLAEAVFHQALADVALGQGTALKQADVDVTRVVELMLAQPHRKWTIETLAQEVSISRSSLAERFTQALRQPPMEYLHHVRMQRAALLLDQPDYKIKRIAAAVGYRSVAAFSHAFRRWSGNSPGFYRRMLFDAHTNS